MTDHQHVQVHSSPTAAAGLPPLKVGLDPDLVPYFKAYAGNPALQAIVIQVQQLRLLKKILADVEPGPVASLVLNLMKETQMSAFALSDDGTLAFAKVTPLDAKGEPTTDPNPLNWSTSDPSVLTVTPSADGLSATFAAVGPLGTAQLSVSDGTFTAAADIQIVAGPVASLVLGLSSNPA